MDRTIKMENVKDVKWMCCHGGAWGAGEVPCEHAEQTTPGELFVN